MREVERALYWIIAGTMGGNNRARIIKELLKKPQNTNQLSKALNLDFKTIQHHLKVLEKNKIVIYKGGGGFAKIYFPSQMLEDNIDSFNKLLQEIEIKNNKKNR
jgi:predicted transcriptional regulator